MRYVSTVVFRIGFKQLDMEFKLLDKELFFMLVGTGQKVFPVAPSPAIMGYKSTKPQRELILAMMKEKPGHLSLK